MAHELVDNIGLGGVEWLIMVSDVLRRMENLKCKPVEELSLGEKTTHRLQSPAGSFLEEVRDVFQLWDLLLAQIDLLLKLVDRPIKLVASIGLEQLNQVAIAEGPHIFLDLGVLEALDRVDHSVVHGHLGDFAPSRDVDRVPEPRMVRILDAVPLRQYPLPNMIEVVNVDGEPGDGFRANLSESC